MILKRLQPGGVTILRANPQLGGLALSDAEGPVVRPSVLRGEEHQKPEGAVIQRHRCRRLNHLARYLGEVFRRAAALRAFSLAG